MKREFKISDKVLASIIQVFLFGLNPPPSIYLPNGRKAENNIADHPYRGEAWTTWEDVLIFRNRFLDFINTLAKNSKDKDMANLYLSLKSIWKKSSSVKGNHKP